LSTPRGGGPPGAPSGGGWTLENYRSAIDRQGFGNAFLNSLAVAIPATIMPIAIAAFAAYAFAWMDFRGRYIMFVVVVGLMVVPLQMALIPILRLFTQGVTLFEQPQDLPGPGPQPVVPGDLARPHGLRHTARHLPAVQLHRLAPVLDHRVRQDGRSRPLHFWRLIVLCRSRRSPRSIFQFMWVWNDLLVAYVFLGGAGQNRVLTVALRGSSAPAAELAPADGRGVHLDALPLVVFFSLQKYFVAGSPPARSRAEMSRLGQSTTAGMEPLPSRRKWRAILAATLLLLPGYWSLVAGIVAIASTAGRLEAGPSSPSGSPSYRSSSSRWPSCPSIPGRPAPWCGRWG
jgi:alpha-glucoside transport system permease protein